MMMDARRYDKNADQLAQILWNLNRLNTMTNDRADEIKKRMIELIHEALQWNDELGNMAEKGLI